MDSSFIFIIVLVVVMGGMMWWQQKKAKEQQQKVKDFRSSLQPGTEIITIGQIIGKVVSVDEQYEEVVIDSEGSRLRVGFNAISREYVRPAYVSDDEVDENGNPIAENDAAESDVTSDAKSDVAQVNVEDSVAANNAEAGTDNAVNADKEAK
ncbi:preprotein translocase subunit YajC [Bifidobacterium callitrichos]|uniref:Preprotein translocase subunit YajC n=2 Tax=Bifidobacterium callitrichos TaxID=762209 RepID=A0A5M9ZDA6_9BIFI|nr:preprotein translocase subunit YajC [Bifidobacterium callitrichos]KAA8817107.1 preprotein translocase subunit YajC [Bifidobacterium callitrichos]KFI52553.1 preprotein translocase subunit [Bifidobacterium callitrichos DSM 23973]